MKVLGEIIDREDFFYFDTSLEFFISPEITAYLMRYLKLETMNSMIRFMTRCTKI